MQIQNGATKNLWKLKQQVSDAQEKVSEQVGHTVMLQINDIIFNFNKLRNTK